VEAITDPEHNKAVYRHFIDILNRQAFDELPDVVLPERYHEICVGFTPGRVNLPDAIAAFKQVLVGIPDLTATIDDCAAEDSRLYARLTVRGTNSGSFYGVPPTHQPYQANMFDYVEFAEGKILERVQQTDALSQLRQMYARPLQRTGTALGALLASSLVVLVVRNVARSLQRPGSGSSNGTR
jgi:predicted ester cyclase